MARSEPRNWLPGWAGRTQVERVELYTRGSLFVIFWFLLAVSAIGAGSIAESPAAIAGILVGAVALGVSGTQLLRRSMELYPDYAPLPRNELIALLGFSAVAEGLVFLLPEDARFAASVMVVGSLTWGAGGLRDRRVQWFLYVASPVFMFAPTGMIGLAAYGLAMGLFLIFTVQSSMWLLGVVNELDTARGSEAALAVAEERLRFSRDVHDVLGRRLSTIAVQAELAATLSERGDPRAPERMLEVRVTAHEALREARELAHGYRPLDLATEVDGAISLLKSAGITATADLGDLPESWHEPVARVIRESVTNVLRHSRASTVTMTYADGEVVIRNEGVTGSAEDSHGTGLSSLREHLEPLGARLETRRIDDEFVVRVSLVAEPRPGGGVAMIRVLLADDENLIRSALAQMLGLEDDIEVVAEAADGAEAIAAALATTPDVAVLDLQMPDRDGIDVAQAIARDVPGCAALIVTSHGRPGYLKRALASGVSGFLPKTTSAVTLAQVVRTVHAGGRHVDPELAAEAMAAGDSPLTPREAEVLEAAAGGAPVETIAANVSLSAGTVRNYLSSASAKLGVGNRHEAVAKARQLGWI